MFSVDPSLDYLFIEGTEVMLYEQKLSDGVYAQPVIVAYGKRNNISRQMQEGQDRLFRLTLIINIWAGLIPNIIPKEGDRIPLLDLATQAIMKPLVQTGPVNPATLPTVTRTGVTYTMGTTALGIQERYFVSPTNEHLSLRSRFRLTCIREVGAML